jgi:hypothetical protein
MIELTRDDSIAILRTARGKAKAMSLEFCQLRPRGLKSLLRHRRTPSSKISVRVGLADLIQIKGEF